MLDSEMSIFVLDIERFLEWHACVAVAMSDVVVASVLGPTRQVLVEYSYVGVVGRQRHQEMDLVK